MNEHVPVAHASGSLGSHGGAQNPNVVPPSTACGDENAMQGAPPAQPEPTAQYVVHPSTVEQNAPSPQSFAYVHDDPLGRVSLIGKHDACWSVESAVPSAFIPTMHVSSAPHVTKDCGAAFCASIGSHATG
jgi:hypothetical protein